MKTTLSGLGGILLTLAAAMTYLATNSEEIAAGLMTVAVLFSNIGNLLAKDAADK